MNRRTFLLSSTALLSLPAILRGYDFYTTKLLSTPFTLLNICSREQITEFGRQYLKLTHYTPDEIEKSLQNALGIDLNQTGNERLLDKMKQQIRHDFRNGNTLVLDGWVLSETEARQCALFTFN